MNGSSIAETEVRARFETTLSELRPKLHRYCARMTGSVIDGEDVLQEALLRAIEAFSRTTMVVNLDAWLFRIAHNVALDVLRRRGRETTLEEKLDTMIESTTDADRRQVAAESLRTLMRLPISQCSAVVLMDVLGYSLEEIGEITESTIPAIKAALHRGWSKLQELAHEPDNELPLVLSEPDRSLLLAYMSTGSTHATSTLSATCLRMRFTSSW